MNSLERRLQYSLATVLVLMLVGLLFIANASTRHILQEFVISRLEHDANNILEILTIKSDEAKVGRRRINPIYNTPYSGHYYSIEYATSTGNKKILNSRSLQDEALLIPENSSLKIQHDVSGPLGQKLIIFRKNYNKNGRQVMITIAEDTTRLKERRKRFRWMFVVMGFIGVFLMLGLQRLIIRRLFLSLNSTRDEVKQIESGKGHQLSEDVPLEIYPLVKEFNHILSLMQQRLERSRNSLGNLAHALKTPLSLLVQQLDNGKLNLEKTGENKENHQALSLAKLQAERIRLLTERELKRARMAGLGNTTQRFDPRKELSVLADVLKQVHQKDRLEVELHIADDVSVFGDREDMLELLGNLLDNACKWANSRVSCSIFMSAATVAKEEAANVTLLIEDDGPGQSPEELELLTQRGIRLDESVDGHGLGLAICKDIVKLYAGTIRFGRSQKLGGFLVEVILP